MKKLIKKIFNNPNQKKIIALGKYQLETNASHMLDAYKKKYPLYDLFLEQICSHFEGLIIDIGANIGDTAISIFSKNDRSFLVGVEPDEEFWKSCLSNIEKNQLQNRFQLVDKFISSEKGSFKIDKSSSHSTGSKIQAEDTSDSNSISFAELMQLVPREKRQKFDLIKIDTDGFDWDVLDSYCDSLQSADAQRARFVFFEFQTFLNNIGFTDKDRPERTLRYQKAIEKLSQNGYDRFALFDNFGTYLMSTSSIEEIVSLSDYIGRSQLVNRHSTFYHMDVLAFQSAEKDFVAQQIEAYQK